MAISIQILSLSHPKLNLCSTNKTFCGLVSEIHSNESSFNFSAWFLILPRMKNMIILGKPSLFKLNYELQPPNKECFTIEGHKYYFEFTDAKGAYKLMELPNNSLLQQLKGTYPAVFTPKIPTSNTSNFTYKVVLRNYPYNKVKPYPTNALQTEAIRIFVEEAVANHIMEEQADDNELIALAPVSSSAEGHNTCCHRFSSHKRAFGLSKFPDTASPMFTPVISNISLLYDN